MIISPLQLPLPGSVEAETVELFKRKLKKYDPGAAHRDPNWSGLDFVKELQDRLRKLEADILGVDSHG